MELDALRKVNLNLLTVFELLMETGSATETAVRLHTTQPGISRKLAELRRLLGDPLFVLVRRQLVPTPRAIEIRPTVREALAAIGGIIENSDTFDPMRSTRTFRIAARHTIEWMLAPALRSYSDSHAPKVRFSFVNMQGVALPEKQLEDHSIDIALGRFEDVGSRLRSIPLFNDDRVCLLRQGHPAAKTRLTPAKFCQLRFVTTTDMLGKENEVDIWLRRAGFQRQFDLYVSSMSHVPLILLQTDLAVTMPRRLATYIAQFHPLHVLELGFKLPNSRYNMVWHARWNDVQSHRWFRDTVAHLMTGSLFESSTPAKRSRSK
jgi:DNA-binding transcriptional LysR family regulator